MVTTVTLSAVSPSGERTKIETFRKDNGLTSVYKYKAGYTGDPKKMGMKGGRRRKKTTKPKVAILWNPITREISSTYDISARGKLTERKAGKGGGRRKSGRRYYDQAAARAAAKKEYERAVGDYGAQLGFWQKPPKPKRQRRTAPTSLIGRAPKRLQRGAGRIGGLAGKGQRQAAKQQRAYRSWRSAEKGRLQRYKEDIESYRETWGL